ncbi:MAG TPA: sigma 54-interacting transcriptional regulator [Clostridiales bacterium]|nr:sigma 54-interacting transcriptional regulator [Clostridiales bacterium]HQP70390.1 sigma 54-interacting transcriptional regulator [Clostridiales bacterium]
MSDNNIPENNNNSLENIAKDYTEKMLSKSISNINLDSLKGNSDKIKEIKDKISFHSIHSEPVLITGASGTGKRLVAHLIHSNSIYKEKPYKEINCLLFSNDRFNFDELIDLPNGGTIYISNTHQLPLQAQLNIIYLLYDDFKNEKPSIPKVRFIFSAESNLIEYVDKGSLQKSFFDLISNFEIKTPSLYEIKDDIKILAESLVDKLNQKYLKQIVLRSDAYAVLKNQLYMNNVHDLKNVLIKSFIHAMYEDNEIIMAGDIKKHFEPYIIKCIDEILVPIPMPENKSLSSYLEEIKIKIYESALNHTSKTLGKKSQKKASEFLNEDQSTISRLENKRKTKFLKSL